MPADARVCSSLCFLLRAGPLACALLTLPAGIALADNGAVGPDALSVSPPADQGSTAAEATVNFQIGMAMIGGSIPDGGDDVGPANEVQDMVERDHPVVTISGMPTTTWKEAQPQDPGSGPDVYDWTGLDAKAAKIIPGKGLLGYYQMWGTSPDWVQQDTPRFWEKFEAFITAMTVHINQNYGPIYYVFENEPNISRAPDGWAWDDWYIHALQHFFAAVHAANAQTGLSNKVIAGNLCGHSAGGFENLYARGLKDCSDLLGYHPYPYDIRDGLDADDLAQIHGIQVTYGDGAKQIYVSEGWGSGRSAGFDRSSPLIEPPATEVENMWLAMVNGYDNVMTPQTNWRPEYLWGMKFFCGNDNWGSMNWRSRATPIKDPSGSITGFVVDGYHMTTDIAPYFWNGGMLDFYGNSKDCLIHVFPGDGLVFMNPGFELASEPPTAHLPHFWTPLDDPAPESRYELDDQVFRGGSHSLRLTGSEPGSVGVSQLTAKRSAKPGESYRTRVWCRVADGAALTARAYVCFTDLQGSNQSARVWGDDVTAPGSWQVIEIVATAPTFASRVQFGCEIDGAGSAWFDDVTVANAGQNDLGTIQGYTLDEGQIPVPYSIVRSTTGNLQAVSDAEGYYEISDAPAGTYDFVCRKAGYVPHRVANQTVAAGKLAFVNFNMGTPKPGLTVTAVECDQPTLVPGGPPAVVTVVVQNARPYPNQIAEVNLFVESAGQDATELFSIRPDQGNPRLIAANSTATFFFELAAGISTVGQSFEVNAYAFGQEDRPNMLLNGGFDDNPWGNHWSFTGGAATLTWNVDSSNFFSPPNALRCYVADSDYSWNWANNWSAYGPNAIPAKPNQSYTVGVHHKDNLTGGISPDLFIQESYYDGSKWYHNGRRFAAVPHRSVWAHDVLIYQTGDPQVTPGLYTTNRLIVSCGPVTSPTPGSGYNWWDDLYVKETGDWLADDRAATGASLSVAAIPIIELSTQSIALETLVRAQPPPGEFTVRNAGSDLLNYAIAPDVAWLQIDPEGGASAGEVDSITVQYNLLELAPGTYTGRIDVADPAAGNSPQHINVQVKVTTVLPDFDLDGDVDQEDFGHLQACMTGAGIPQTNAACLNARLDPDPDVDQADFFIFRNCFTHANTAPSAGCADP